MEIKIKKLAEELDQELRENILPYWIKYSVDSNYGGFVGQLSRKNEIADKAVKGSVLNARILWTFSAAYRMYKEDAYLKMAERAHKYFQEHFIDREYGGVYWDIDYRGGISNPKKQIYALAFAMYAMTEYYMATGDKKALSSAIELYETIETRSFDKNTNGYIDAFSRDWKIMDDIRLSEKDANESKTMNTHLHLLEAYTNLYRVWDNDALKKALKNIIILFTDKFVDPETYHLRLFFDDDWNLKSDIESYGHDIECSWLLFEAAEILGDSDVLKAVKPVSIQIARKSFNSLDIDHGMFNEASPGEASLDTDKHWWHQAEAMVGYYNAWELTEDVIFADKTIRSWEFIKNHIIDREYGEWFWKVNQQGVPNLDDEKAGIWKCPYHNSRACMEIIRRSKNKK